MLFYALRVVCPNCGAASLFGGGTGHDLTRWRKSAVECHRCGAEILVADAPTVDLGALPRGAEPIEKASKGPPGA